MEPPAERLISLLQHRYASGPVTLHDVGELNPVYRVDRAEGPPWVIRAGRNVPRIATTLLHLDSVGHPAPRLIPASDGAPVTFDGDPPVLVMTLIPGTGPPLAAAPLEAVGGALGRLHALPPVSCIAPPETHSAASLPTIERAGMQPRGEMAHARSRLDSVRDRVPSQHLSHFRALERACDTLDLCEDLPPVLIHGDAHYNNTILTPDGEVAYVDYDSAGPGPAIVDLGFLLVNADAAPLVGPPKARDPARADAVIRGYCRFRVPTDDELPRLVHAIRFRPIVWACGTFAEEITRGAPPSSWPLERVEMSDDLADRAIAAVRAQAG